MDHDWKKNPLKFDPNRGYFMCKPCWNGQHWNAAFIDADGVKRPKTNNCLLSKFKGLGECGCGCNDPGPRKPKFTGEGQTKISMENPLTIGPKS